MNERAQRLMAFGLGLWAVGVQLGELFATIGAWATAVSALALAWPLRTLRPWAMLLAFLGWALAMPLLTGHAPTATGVARLADFLLVPAAAFAVAHLPRRSLERAGLAAAVALVVSACCAALQHLGIWPSAEAVAALPWHPVGFMRVYEAVPGREDRFMAGGLLLHRLKFANVTAVMCVLGTSAVTLRVPRWRGIAGATVIGLVALSIFPHARAASVAAVLSVALVWVLGAPRRGRALLAASGLVALALLVGALVPSVRARFEASLTNEGSGERTSLTRAGLAAIATSPIGGVGPGRFRPGSFLPEDAPAQAREHVGKAHNQFVTIAAEAGIPAALLLVLALLGWALSGVRALPRGAALVGMVALFVLLGLLHDPLFHVESSLALMLGLGVGLGVVARESGAVS